MIGILKFKLSPRDFRGAAGGSDRGVCAKCVNLERIAATGQHQGAESSTFYQQGNVHVNSLPSRPRVDMQSMEMMKRRPLSPSNGELPSPVDTVTSPLHELGREEEVCLPSFRELLSKTVHARP